MQQRLACQSSFASPHKFILHEVEAQECLLQEHPCISPHACCFGRWGNCSPTMRTGRCTECTLQMTVYGHGKIELQPFAWSGSTGMLAARASVHKSPCMLLWQMRKLQMTVYGHGKIELQPFAWSGSTGMLAARASVHKSPCMLLWQMRKLFTHHEDWAVHRVYTANDCLWTWQNWTATFRMKWKHRNACCKSIRA